MSRIKTARQMISYLEERINCENVMKYANKTTEKIISEKTNLITRKLNIEGTPVSFEIMNYNDTENYVTNDKTDVKDRRLVKHMFSIFDFMTEANYTGFEYFPYIYGVLNCHDSENSKIYTYHEYFTGNLVDLINNMEHPSEWYDVVFQIIMINYYIEIINGYKYNNGYLQNHYYKKLDKPYYKEYEFNGKKISVNHKYLVVIWGIDHMEKNNDNNKDNTENNIDYLLKYFSDNKDKIKIAPSPRIIKLLNDIKNNINDTQNIILQYYSAEQKK
ncbi:hypothetical protein QJ857_gp0178 [Tupanvirus soda lake]|uniref:Uncharacterized protein n=2 Tax=Tupanvirus TaxID=2094720 RepID=A0A6N1NX32_9VIRU|nr:hypothetical protein QJ857_gp0178 [Tupanvirus soda lake]QKU35846.1 hypothetical protein [Tupanvirus soda lake]